MTEELVLVERNEGTGVATVTLNRPKAMNAMSRELNERLVEIASELTEDTKVRVIVITGAPHPDKAKGSAFSAGADLRERKGLDGDAQPLFVGAIREAVLAWFKIPKPKIARIHGWCLGGGLELALACDWIYSTFSQFPLIGFPEVDLAIIPGAGGTQLLQRRLSAAKALQLISLGKTGWLRPQEAKDWGVIDQVLGNSNNSEIENAQLLDLAVVNLALSLAAKPPRSLFAARTAIHAGWSQGFNAGLVVEGQEYGVLIHLKDWVEAREALAEGRPPVFTGA